MDGFGHDLPVWHSGFRHIITGVAELFSEHRREQNISAGPRRAAIRVTRAVPQGWVYAHGQAGVIARRYSGNLLPGLYAAVNADRAASLLLAIPGSRDTRPAAKGRGLSLAAGLTGHPGRGPAPAGRVDGRLAGHRAPLDQPTLSRAQAGTGTPVAWSGWYRDPVLWSGWYRDPVL
jgi:hypothetical protein